MTNSAYKFAGAIVTGTFGFGIIMTGALAADIDTGCIPAVSAINGKLEGAGGYYQDDAGSGERFQGVASLSLPIGCLLGIQVDVGAGDLDGDGFAGIGGHIFTRDPSSYLLGVQAQYVDISGDSVFRVGPEAELYLDNITLSAMAGFENAKSFGSDDVVAQLEAAYYIDDNFKLYGGYRRFLNIDAGAIGLEFDPGFIPGSVFVDAMAGSDDYVSVMAGFRFYFGGGDKSLKARQREDDPGHYFNLLNRTVEKDKNKDHCVPTPTDGQGDTAVVDFCDRLPTPK
jgi:hypothetical protein